MGVEVIPETKIFTCDGCGLKHEIKRATTSWTRPPHWTRLHWERDAYDFQGNACADASVHRLLCASCSTVLGEAINTAFQGIQTMKQPGDGV